MFDLTEYQKNLLRRNLGLQPFNRATTLKVENFAGTKFRGFRGFRGQPRNLIPAKPLTLPIREI